MRGSGVVARRAVPLREVRREKSGNPNPRDVSEANEQPGRSSRSGRAVWYPPPLGRAEQRSSVRIKTLALFERSEFASVPNAASSARNPKGTDVARLFFGYFFLALLKKSNSPAGARPG